MLFSDYFPNNFETKESQALLHLINWFKIGIWLVSQTYNLCFLSSILVLKTSSIEVVMMAATVIELLNCNWVGSMRRDLVIS